MDSRFGVAGLSVNRAPPQPMPHPHSLGSARVAPGHPYFMVEMRDGTANTRGQVDAEFGHRIVSGTHDVADGVFARWRWDGNRLMVENDRYGFFPLFWFRAPGGGVCVSSSLVALIEQGAPTELDVEALAVFLRLGFFVGNDTPFASIKVVPPNAVFAWENGKLQCEGRYPPVPNAAAISRDDAIDRYIDLFAKAMARRVPTTGASALPISGGRDSRHILLELHRTGFEPSVCVSVLDHPPDPNEDPEIAAALCGKLGFELVVVDQQLSLFSAQVRKNLETHLCASAHGWYLALADFLNGNFQCTYDGIAGDVLSQSKFLSAQLDGIFHSKDVNAICDALLARQASSFSGAKTLLKGSLKQSLVPSIAKARLAKEVARHLEHPNPVGSFIFWNRTRREIALAPYGLLRDIPRVYAPFLDHDLFDFLVALPSAMLLDHHFHDDAIARAYPDFAGIPYARNAAPQADDSATRTRFSNEAARAFLLRKPSRLMKNLSPRVKMLASMLSGGRVQPWISPLIVYLGQLESIAYEGR